MLPIHLATPIAFVVTFVQGTLTQVSQTIVNPWSGASLTLSGPYYVNTAYVDGGPATDDILLTSVHTQFFRLQDDNGNRLIDGFEIILMSDGADVLDLTSTIHVMGDVIIEMSEGADVVWANVGNDTINGGDGDDLLDGGPGNDTIGGGADNDVLAGGAGDDLLDGGPGDDEARYLGTYATYLVTDNGGVLTIQDLVGGEGTDTVQNVERIVFADGVLAAGVFTQTPFPASSANYGVGCASSGGANTLSVTSPAWIDTTFEATATGMPTLAIALAVTSLTPIPQGVLPLDTVWATAGTGCDLLVIPDILAALVTSTGTLQSQLFLPGTPPLVGLTFYHQIVPIEIDGTGAFVSVTATNALAVTVGSL
ncbi:MAG: hypothetical protein JNL08_20925 [Planctomycetes bacterium]|nr:hypothetical protein [Planctomycetota bacterium]